MAEPAAVLQCREEVSSTGGAPLNLSTCHVVDHNSCGDSLPTEFIVSEVQPGIVFDLQDDNCSMEGSMSDSPQSSWPSQRDGRPRRRRRATMRQETDSDAHDVGVLRRSVAVAEAYRFSNRMQDTETWADVHGAPLQQDMALCVEKGTPVSLGDLVKYNPIDLFSRAWLLVPSELKRLTCPPFGQLPELPDVMNALHSNNDEVARFMRLTALEVAKRRTVPTPFYLRCLLVRAAVRLETGKTELLSFSTNTYSEESIQPQWEDESEVTEEVSSSDTVPTTDANHIDAFDWTMAVLSESLHPRVPHSVISMLHRVLNRCGIKSSSETLRSWGIGRLIQILLHQIKEETGLYERGECGTNWLTTAVDLLFKLVLASRNADALLAIFRWAYKNRMVADALPLKNVPTWITSIEANALPRMRLDFPTVSVKLNDIPLIHSLGLELSQAILGMGVVTENGDPYGVVFTKRGVYKFLLIPPYSLVGKNEEDPVTDCRGVFLEDGQLVVQSKFGCTASFYDVRTLRVSRVLENRGSEQCSEMYIYNGMERFVTPHFYHNKDAPLFAAFHPRSGLKGRTRAPTLFLPSGSDSASLQFLIFPTPTQQHTSMKLLYLSCLRKHWISVSVVVDGQNSLMSMVFEHGEGGVVVEVREPIHNDWALWGATLQWVNNVAMWNIFKNGVLIRSCAAGGASPSQSGTKVSISLFEGTFSGFISGLRIWHRSIALGDMLASANGRPCGVAQGCLLCCFKMNEGTGCCLRSAEGAVTWKGPISWAATPTMPFNYCVEESERIPYVPHDDYYVVTNTFETAIIESGFCTWIDKEGRVLEQQAMDISPAGLYYLCANTGQMYSYVSEGGTVSSLRCFETQSLPPAYVRGLESERRGALTCQEIVHLAKNRQPVTPIMMCKFILHRINTTLLIEGIDKNTVHSAPQFFSWNRASPQTLARLLSILEDLLPLVSIPNAEDDTLLLLTCVCGRLLTQQMSWIRRECPPNLVPVTVGMYERLNGCECQPGSFQREVQDVFTELHRVFLIRCASYDYQLQRITEVTKLADLKDLLTADYIPSFVAILLKREELKKPFMTFLNRLKEECVSESKSVLNGEVSAAFKPSSVMLSVLLSIFSQKINPQWHLVAVALVNSLCSNIMQLFDRIVVGVRSDMSLFATRLDLLKQTSLGVVVFPIVHFLSDVDIDSSVAVEILTLLEKTQRLLLPYICASNSESTQHCIVETHGINIPASSSHTTILDLRHARSVEISHDCSTTDDIPEIRVTLVTNTLQRNVEVMQSQRAAFECGGIFEISVNNKQELTVTLDAQVEIRTDQTHWIHDICFAISYAILYSTHQLLLTGLLNPLVFTRESILRAGLTEKVLKEHRVYTKRNEIAFNKTDLTDLIQLSEGTGDVFNLWQSILSQRRVPHLEKVEHVLRVFCAAHVWHLHRPQQTTLKAQLEASLDFIRKKCILILEVMQQKGEDGMLERAKFLLYDVNPREKVEFCIAEQQQTEEPLVFRSGDYHQHLRHDWHSGMRGSTRTSCDGESRGLSGGLRSARRLASESSVVSHGKLGSVTNPRNPLKDADNVYTGMPCAFDVVSTRILEFLIYGYNEMSCEELTCTLVQKMQQAVLHAELYRLQGDLVATHQFDTDMIWSILSLHLRRREQVYVQSLLEGKRKGFVGKHPPADPATYSTPITLDRPHIEPLLGCGFQHELELQKAFCTFFNTLVQQSDVNCPKPVDPRSSCSALTVIPICAMLCHPWDNMDASFMNHDSVFNFLEKCIRVSLDDASNHSSQKSDGHIPWYLPAQECGLFSVQNRCGIIPNTLHPVARNAVDIINGDTVGVHIEDIEVVCLAQNDWKLVKTDTRMNDIETQDDFASVATGCLLIDVPEVLYFEMTLEIVLSSEIVASIGVTESQRTLQKSEVSDNTITLCSDGFVRCGDTATRFVEEWSVGDVIGCGVIVPSRSVFFTRRGEFLGIARECPFTVAQPLVSAKANDGLVKLIVNFGGNVPFAFDITSLHSSCLSQLTSLAMISESAFLTSHYIVGLCFKNLLAHEQSLHPLTVDSTGTLLERASAFVCASALRCVARLKEICNDRHTDIAVKSVQYESTNILLARLFTTANTVIDCFRFNSVTPGTHLSIVRFCCLALTTTRERWIKVRAARCLGVLASVLRHDYLTATITKLEKCGVKLEVVVDSLVELARVSTTRCSAQSAFVAQWANGKARVAGSGAFYGKTPLPKKGKHIVGFRIRRHKLMARARGAPLGGDYYIGLVSGHSHTVDIKSLIEREDVYTLHNGNYYTQVNHPLATHLRHHHENHRRAYGNDQIVWLELNAGTGEIIFYRDDMEPTGTVFSGIKKVDNLYPFVFLFNEDAVCDLIRAPTQLEEYTDDFVVGFRRSVAVHALQQLHLVPPFDSKISRWIRSHLKRSRKDIGNCLVALALLGGEKSHLFCHHETHGAVVVHSVSHSTSKAIVHLDADSEMHLLATDVTSLKPSFVLPPVFSAAETEGQKCGKWLVDELRSVLREIFTIVPLLNDEEEQRRRIESLFSDTVVEIANTAFVSLHMQQQDTTKRQATKDHLRGVLPSPAVQSTFSSFRAINGEQPLERTPVTIDRRLSSYPLSTPSPSIAITPPSSNSVIRGNLLLGNKFSFSVSITVGTSKGAVMYIGVSSETDLPPEPQAVARSKDVWALCTHDSAATNSINCSVEPGMIFGAVEACFDSGDVVCVMVDRSEGTAAFSRCRAGKWVNFGVLFESIPPNKLLRPIVVTVPDSVVVFSFLDCHTFPSRNAFPPSSVGTCTHSTPPISCTSCDRNLIQEWYEGEGGVCLCHECFNMWHYPKTMFYLSRPEDPIPDYLLSQCSPKALVVGELVNFTENAVLTWSTDKSVNVEVEKSVCMAVEDGAFAVLDLLSPNVSPRIDVLLSHVAGIKGFAFSGLHNFNLLWQAKNTQKRNVDIEENTLLVSSTVISQGLKVVLELTFSNSAGGDISNTRRVFVGVAGAVVDCRKASSADFERYLANGNICGTWCDLYFAASASRTLFLLIDTRKASVMMSFSLLGLHTRPAVVSCSSVAEEDTGLRIAIFSRSPYRVTSTSGWVSTDEGVLRFSSSYVAVGLVSEEAIGPRLDVMNSKKLLFDTVAHTSAQCNNLWQIAPLVHEEGSGILFSIGDILTVETENGLLTVYRNGLLIATHPMSEEMISKPQKFMIYLSTRGMMATVVPPIYGKLHVGKVVQTFGADVGAVECLCPCVGKQRYIVRRRDVHHCAISASVLQPAVGSKVSFKVGSLFNPKRGSVISVDENTLTVCEDGDDKHLPITVKRSNAFLLDNEGADKVEQTPYPLLALPDSATVRVFEVGSTKYKQQCSTSYNGIMFDVRAHSAAILTGLTVMTCSQGRHRVEVFFKRGSHESHEKEAMSWTKLFSNYVDMHTGTQFSVKFRGVLVEANSTFALYINATHNCGVGYYTVQEGCSGGLSSVVDSDGALTVFMGRVSESSTPFCRVVHQTHGFCGSIVYVQSKGSQTDALWEMGTAPYNSDWWHHGRCATMPGLLSKPSSTLVSPTLEFTLEVHDQAMVLQRLLIPIYIDSKTCQSRGPANLHVSLFYAAFQCDVVDPDEADHNWVWVCHKTVAMGDNMHQFCLDDLCIELSRGTYIFTAVCEKSMGLGSGKMWERLPCFVRPSLGRNWSVRNKCCAVHGFAGYLYAVSSRNATSYGAKTTLSTGGGLFQDSVSSSNGILFDICSKRDILLEELFCVAQATAENVQVAVFWREGSLIGAEQSPRMWKCLVTNELNLEKRKVFSPGRLNIHLSAGCVYALYVTTTSSCGVRFYNGADGIVGKVGHKFDEDANLTVFVGKRSDGLVPFSNVPADPRAFRGLITYRTLAQANSPMKNASTFPAIKGFVATRILAALIALSNNPATFTKLFVDSHLADLLVKLISSSASIVVNEDSVDHSPCDVIDEKLLSALCEGSITLLSSGNDVTRFSSLCKGDLAVVASSMGVLTRGTVVRLIDDPDAGRDVSVQNTTDNPGEVCAIPISNLLPIVECSYCYKPFAVKDTCTVAGQSHLPTFKVEEQLINILAKHLIQRHDKASSEGSALAASIVHRAKTPAVALSALMNPDKRARCYGTTIGSNTVEYIVPLYLLYSNKSGTYSDFVYVNVMSAFVALSFVPCVDGWQLNLLTDLPLRLIGHPGAKAFLVTLNATSDHKDEYELTLPPVQYCTGYGGPASQHLLTLVDSLLSYTLPLQDGCLHLRLSLYETALPPKTAKVSGFHAAQSWLWAGGYRVVELKPTISHEIDGVFSNATWPQDKPRFWQLTVTSSANVNVFFLEVVVFFPKRAYGLPFGINQKNNIRCSVSVGQGETLTIGFTADGDLVVYDTQDHIRCQVLNMEGSDGSAKDSPPRIAVANVGPHPVIIYLHPPVITHRTHVISHSTNYSSTPGSYAPRWAVFDPKKTTISNKGLTASCNGVSGQVVIGTQLPMVGLSGFVVQISRSDRTAGDSLGSGHFAGVVVSTFDKLEPHFEELRKDVDCLWIVQDVHDNDSLPTQEPIPLMDVANSAVFLSGTKLCFLLDRDNGTLSIARDYESPRIVFRNIPTGLSLSPFVRLDHAEAQATLSSFTCGLPSRAALKTPPHALLITQAVTPTNLRRAPYDVALSIFPVLRHVVCSLPPHLARAVSEGWGDHYNTTRFTYRLSVALRELANIGALSRHLTSASREEVQKFCSKDEVQHIIKSLAAHVERPCVVRMELDGADDVIILLPKDYEVVGILSNEINMLRLLHFDGENSPTERTLHLFRKDCRRLFISSANATLKHPCVMYQEEIVYPLGVSPFIGVITHGWFDGTLASMDLSAVDSQQQRKIVLSFLTAVEHWHLHGLVHGHIAPQNVYLNISGSPTACVLWNVHILQRSSDYASPELISHGVRDTKGDIWSCAQVLSRSCIISAFAPTFAERIEAMKVGNTSISAVIEMIEGFSDEYKKIHKAQTHTLQTTNRVGQAESSCNGIMFDVVARQQIVQIAEVGFFSDTTSTVKVTLFARNGTFQGVEMDKSQWRLVIQREMNLRARVEAIITGFEPLVVPPGERLALFIHTESEEGILYYAGAESTNTESLPIEEEDDFVGITVGKTTVKRVPFTNVRQMEQLFSGSITYVATPQSSMCRSQLATRSAGPPPSQVNRVGVPVVVNSQRCGLLIKVNGDRSLVFLGGESAEWWHSLDVEEVEFDGSSIWEELESSLQKKLWESQLPIQGVPRQAFCVVPLRLHKSSEPSNAPGNVLSGSHQWWVSDSIRIACMLSIKRLCADRDVELFVATSVEGSATMYSSVSAVEHSDLILIRMDEWSRSVLSIDDHGEKIVAELPDGLSRADVRLVCRCIQAEKENIAPVCATLLSSRDDLMILETFGAPAFISFRASERPWCQLLLVGDRLVKCSWKPGDEPPSFTASTIDHSHNVYAVLIPHLSQQEPAIERQLAQTETSEWMSSCLVAHEQFRSKWVQREVVLCAQSSSLFVSGNCVQKVSVEVPSCCTAVEPHFEGVNVHEVELTVVMSTANPVQVIFRDAASQWCVAVPVAALCRCYQRCALKVDTAMSINLTLRVFPSSRCAFVIVDKSMIFEVLQGVTTFAARFNLAFSLTGLGSSVTITRWQVLEDGETPVTHSALDRIWGELNIRNISPYVPYSVAVSNCQTQRPLAPALTSGTCSTLLSQVEGLMVFYAWKLLGNMMVITTDRSTVEYLQQLMSSFIVRNNITVLENLMRTEMQRSSFLMLATASSSLAAPPVAQSLQEVEVSVNIVLGALRNDAMMPLLSTAYGPTLTLLLLRTAVAYTRTIRHMSLRCAILLLKTTHCPLPPHEALCSTLGPLFALMDKLCDKGKISSILVQLGTLLVCELTLRYALERPLLPVPGKNSSLPYALVTCAKVAVEAMMSKPPTPLPGIFAPPSEKVHNITYKLVTESRGFGDYLFCSGEFSESFTPTSGTKEFEARLSPSRVGIVVAGWNINPRVEPLDHQLQELYQEESTGIVALPSCGYSVDPDGNVFLCVGHRRESRPLKAKALDGDIIHVTCDYREHTIFIRLKRGSVDIISSHHNALSSEVMGLPVYFSESEADAHFNGEGLLFNSFTRADTVKLYPDAHELKEYQDTGVVPQSYEFYEELSLFRETLRASNKLGSSDFSEDPWIVPSHELADFRVLLDFLGADAFGNEALLNRLVPYLKRLQIFNAITSQFWKFVDVRHQTEMLELWRKLKNICFVETIEKLQEKVMGPFLNRPGHTTTVIIHPLRAKPCAQHGLYTALMRSVFGQLFIQLNASHAATFYASPMFTVNLAGFASIDAGGPYRDVISQLAAEIMTTHPGGMFQTNPLFRRCEHGGQVVVMPNMLVTLNMQSSLMFEFFGKLLAYCFVSEDILAVAFPPLFWKLLLSENISPRDLNVVDGVLMQQLNPEQPPAHAQEELGQGFPVTRSHYAALPSNGLQLERTPQLQPTYIHRAETLSRQDSLIELHSYDMVMRHIQRGFSEVVPLYLLNVFRWQTVERLICGAPKLSYAALRAVCEVNLNAASAHMFDEVISSMTDEDRMLVLRFATGQSRLPLRENIKVEPGGAANSLPTGATCFFTLRLPEYSSVDIMREKVLYAVRQCATIDGDGQAQGRVLLDD